jgi:glycosyltransferase involved in cell wall biosynthesis
MANALALILPINWPEPFGMVFIEALACGTPVLTCPRGSVPELLEDGVTGYSGCTVAELVEAVGKVRHISREGCRSYAARRFDSSRMASEYVDVYRELRGQRRRSFVTPDPLIAHPTVPDILTRAPKPARRVADSVHGAALS